MPGAFAPDLPPEHIPSEYCASNQVLFRAVHAYRRISGQRPGLVGFAYDGERYFLPMFDLAEVGTAELDGLIRKWGCLYPVPEAVALRLKEHGFPADSNDDDSDYVYEARAFETYAGRALHPKRNLCNQFVTQAGPRSENLAGHEEAAIAVLRGWRADVGKSTSGGDFEPCCQAIHRLGELGLTGRITVAASGEPVGFVIASQLGTDCAVMHFAKGRRAFNGAYPFMFRDFVCHQPGVRWLNFEQDLGNPGFRQNKQSFVPHHRIVKYRVRQRLAASR